MGRQYRVTGYKLNLVQHIHLLFIGLYTADMYCNASTQAGLVSLEHRLSALDFVLQLWNKNLEQKARVKASAGLHCQHSQVET